MNNKISHSIAHKSMVQLGKFFCTSNSRERGKRWGGLIGGHTANPYVLPIGVCRTYFRQRGREGNGIVLDVSKGAPEEDLLAVISLLGQDDVRIFHKENSPSPVRDRSEELVREGHQTVLWRRGGWYYCKWREGLNPVATGRGDIGVKVNPSERIYPPIHDINHGPFPLKPLR